MGSVSPGHKRHRLTFWQWVLIAVVVLVVVLVVLVYLASQTLEPAS